jgi:hypothetical protein
MASSWHSDRSRHTPHAQAQGRLAFRPVNSARRSREDVRSAAGRLLPFAVLAVTVGLGFVWIRIRYTETAYRLATLRQVVVQLENERRDLAMAVAAAESPAQLERAARELGLVPPTLTTEVPLR